MIKSGKQSVHKTPEIVFVVTVFGCADVQLSRLYDEFEEDVERAETFLDRVVLVRHFDFIATLLDAAQQTPIYRQSNKINIIIYISTNY